MDEQHQHSEEIAEILEIITKRRDEPVIEIEEKTLQVVIFRLDEKLYACYGKWVKEIFPVSAITYVPGMPEYLLGVMNVRGDIESVIDMRAVLGMPYRTPGKQSRICLAEAAHVRSGILVDTVENVMELPEESFVLMESVGNAPNAEYVIGGTRYHEQDVVLLDLEKMFTHLLGSELGTDAPSY
ncbi:chemotaxis signal transduction protein [Candidatus Moduliflexus flocculans]|uniref:Chemotaxis signal transduction protein n=1 Tax=Candidatus Moduliflexus flocculans TaxID=1499966 RepID=A0A081BM74_9BACT|nr:chemotaxis signal transduction protein [Candidatus Moduliflexus flocculans]